MNSPLRTALLFVAVAIGLQAQTPSLTGNWKTAMQKLDDGTDYCAYFQLEQKGSEVTGRVVYPWGFAKVANGKVDGSRFRFEQPLWEGLTFKDEGEIAGNELKYSGTFWDGKHDYVAHRVPDGEGNPPARLPLPEIRPLPANGLAKTPPMGWNCGTSSRTRSTTKWSATWPTRSSPPACATPATSTSTSTTPGKGSATPRASSSRTTNSPT